MNRESAFWSRVDIPDNESCWEWKGRRYKRKNANYGAFDHDGKCSRAHRLAYELFFDTKIPEGQCVLHRCDNPPCVNPLHLYVGTQQDNVLDCVRRGRTYDRHGERNPNARLSLDEVRLIRWFYKRGNWKQRELAKMARAGITGKLRRDPPTGHRI